MDIEVAVSAAIDQIEPVVLHRLQDAKGREREIRVLRFQIQGGIELHQPTVGNEAVGIGAGIGVCVGGAGRVDDRLPGASERAPQGVGNGLARIGHFTWTDGVAQLKDLSGVRASPVAQKRQAKSAGRIKTGVVGSFALGIAAGRVVARK